jgi:hypothetical protein
VFERYFGKPYADTISVDPLPIGGMTMEERALLLRRVLDDHPQLVELAPERRAAFPAVRPPSP